MPRNKPERPEPELVEGREAFATTAAQLAGMARRELAVLSFDLPAWAYGTPSFCDAVRGLILSHQRARVRVLIHDVPAVATQSHRLLHLLRELSSYTEIRTLAEHQRGYRDDCLIADEHQVLERDTPESLTARVYRDAPVSGRAARRRFDDLWDGSEPASALRRLYL